MKTKKYSEQAVQEMFDTLRKNVEGGRCVARLQELYNEVNVPQVKIAIVSNINAFLCAWFKLLKDVEPVDSEVSKVFLSKVVNKQFIDYDDYIKDVKRTCTKVKSRITNILPDYVRASLKAVIQTKRREMGLDKNSSKFGQNKTA